VFAHPVVVLDFETTGLNVEGGDRVTEVAAVRIQGGKIAARFESLVNCRRYISGSISKFTHITQAMIDSAPESDQVFGELIQFIGNDIVFAHNAAFDQHFFRAECTHAGLLFNPRDFRCSVKLAQYVFPSLNSHALGPLACSMGIRSEKVAHRAGADVDLTAAVLLKMVDLIAARHGRPFVHVSTLDDLVNNKVSAAA
jgi:DNA polymerase III subunit epsilon